MPDALWTGQEIAQATGGVLTGDWSVSGVSIDTRSLQPGELFVALTDQRDGHEFVDQAFENGATGCLVSRDVGRPGVLVDDVLAALERLGAAARARTGARCAAITGSVGKTSVKEMLARIFRAAGPAHWSVKSFNNHWGVPLTLSRMPAQTERAIFEIGMSTPGEIAPRSEMVRPHVVMITRISPAHIQNMGTLEAVADEKADIAAGLLDGGVAILPADDAFFAHLQDAVMQRQPAAVLKSFGGPPGASDACVMDYQTDGATSTIKLNVEGHDVAVSLDAVGEHWAGNAALAVLAASLAGIEPQAAAAALSGYAPPEGRGAAEPVMLATGGQAVLVDDSYNANPDSMRAALEGLSRRSGRKVVVIGEMRELGPDSIRLHTELAAPIVAAGAATVVLSGDVMKPLADELLSRNKGLEVIVATDPASASEALCSLLRDGDTVLIKGSNASGMARVGSALRTMSETAKSSQKASGAKHVV